MSTRTYTIDTIGLVLVVKSRRSKHVRLTIKHDGTVRVSLPLWLPFKVGADYATSKQDWIKSHQITPELLQSNIRIGKAHRLIFIPKDISRTYSRVHSNQILVTYPSNLGISDSSVQRIARKACIRALIVESNQLLVARLNDLAIKNNFFFRSVAVKKMQSRWGSCDSNKCISLNCFLIQLSWKEIDYVLLHELSHTEYMSHNKDFWMRLTECMPEAKLIKSMLSHRKPDIIATQS